MAPSNHSDTSDTPQVGEKAPVTDTGSPKVEQNTLEIDHAAERKLVRKLDFMIIPPVMLTYLFSFLDRVNIGNARLYGLEEDLNMEGDQFQTAVSLLFVTYILSETPSNLVIKKFTPSRWLSFLTTTWGITATLTGITQSYGGLLACRLVLGALEGGLFPGLTIYLTLFYTRREIALRVGYLFVSAAISGSVGGLLAYGIGFMDGVAGQRGWRWIMIIEGLPTIVLGIAVWFWFANDPESAYYLTPEEKQLVIVRKKRQSGYSKTADDFSKTDVIKAFKDWKIWMFCLGQFGVDTMLYGYSTFLPTIIRGLGDWTAAQVQCLTIPCYALGAISYLTVAWVSDRLQMRGIFTVVFGLISIIGYIILLCPVANGVKYFGCFVVALGLYVVVGIPLGWLPANNPRYGKRTTATGLQLTCGNLSGIFVPFVYPTGSGPRYILGHAVTLAMVAMAVVVYAIMSGYFLSMNKKRAAGKENWKRWGKSDEAVTEMGDASPDFLYTY